MQALFYTLNQTWPNPKHIFLNNAKGGASLDSIVDASCSSTFTPDDEVDLAVVGEVDSQVLESEVKASDSDGL